MMEKKDFKPRIFYRLSLEEMVSQDHLVRALEEILDMNFIRGLCRKYYPQTGQPSVDPIVLFKMMLIGYLSGITSERKLAEECTVNLAFRWYLGYDLDEVTPNHSVISKARGRFGKKVFSPLIEQGSADFIIAFEKLEALRYSYYLKKNGVLIVNDREIPSMSVLTGAAHYPLDIKRKLKKYGRPYFIEAATVALELGNIRVVNIILLGVLSKFLAFKQSFWERAIRENIRARFADLNIAAFNKGKGYC